MGKKRKSEKVERVSFIPEEGGVLAEVIFDPSLNPPIQFAVYDGKKVEISPSVIVNGKQLDPPNDPCGLAAKGFLLLPSCAMPYGSQEKLLAEIVGFVHRYAEVPEHWEEIIAYYALMAWVYDRFTALPYLRFWGEPGTGKSRLLQVAGHLCYKTIIVGAGMTTSPLFRLLDAWRGTFVVDEAELTSDASSEIVRIFNAGYMEGSPLIRSEAVGESFEARAFKVFGPKIIANRSRFRDAGLESRCFTFQTVERSLRKDIPRQLPPQFFTEAQELRNKLLQWRFENHAQVMPDESGLEGLENRRAQIAIPLLSVSKDNKFKNSFIAFLKEQQTEERAERPQTVVSQAIYQLCKGNAAELLVKDVAKEANKISERLEMGVSFTPKGTGHLIRSLGFEPKHSRDGAKFRADKKCLAELAQRYGME